jgi:hypothetical protein
MCSDSLVVALKSKVNIDFNDFDVAYLIVGNVAHASVICTAAVLVLLMMEFRNVQFEP